MRTTYTKHNSQTQAACRQAKDAVARVCEAAKMSRDHWNTIMFEMGCEFVEACMSKDVALEYLTDYKHGFWAWWISIYVQNDADIAETIPKLSIRRYKHIKLQMSGRLTEVYEPY